MVPGDGVGQELSESVKSVFKADNVPIEWEQFDLSGHVSANDDLMKETLASLRRNKVGLKGILYTPVSRLGHASFNVSMRKVYFVNKAKSDKPQSIIVYRISIFMLPFL